MPIAVDSNGATDSLRRSRFAQYLLDVACEVDAARGAVLGLEGSWGGGKTWVVTHLRELAEQLPEKRRPVFIEFNPWMLTGAHDLVFALLTQLRAQVLLLAPTLAPGFAEKVAERISAYAGAFTAIKHLSPAVNVVLPGAGLLLEAAAVAGQAVKDTVELTRPALARRTSEPPSLHDLRQKVDQVLSEASSRFIVVVDDLDRIPPQDVAAMVQAVKAVANFPNTVYLLAYDKAVIAESLGSSLGLSDGHAYLEKIVQLPIPLPDLPAARIQQWAEQKLRSAATSENLSADELSDLKLALPIASAMMQTPRDVLRIETRLRVTCPHLEGRVNIADVVVAEALTLKVPRFAGWLEKHRPYLLSKGHRVDDVIHQRGLLGSDDSSEDADDPEQATVDASIKAIEELRNEVVDERLRHAAARAAAYLFQVLEDWDPSSESSTFRRLHVLRFLHRWQCFIDHHDLFDVDELEGWVKDPLSFEKKFVGDREGFASACDLMEELWPDSLPTPGTGWLRSFATTEKSFGTEFLMNSVSSASPFSALEAGLRKLPSSQRVEELSAQALNQCSLYLSGQLLVTAYRDAGKLGKSDKVKSTGRLVEDDQQLAVLAEQWLYRYDQRLQDGDWKLDRRYGTYSLSQLARAFGKEADQIRAHASEQFVSNPTQITAFLAGLADGNESPISGLNVVWDLLPDPNVMRDCISKVTDFSKSHSLFAKQLEARCIAPAPTPAEG